MIYKMLHAVMYIELFYEHFLFITNFNKMYLDSDPYLLD